MRYALLVLLAVAAACYQPAEGQPAGPTATSTEALPTAESLRDEACGCTTIECGERVTRALEREREHVEATLDGAETCLDRRGFDGGHAVLVRKLTELREAICGCPDKACVEAVQKEIMEWAMKNMDVIRKATEKITPKETEEFSRIEREMEACMKLIDGGEATP